MAGIMSGLPEALALIRMCCPDKAGAAIFMGDLLDNFGLLPDACFRSMKLKEECWSNFEVEF